MYRPHFAYSFICGWTLVYFHLLATVINATMNTGIQIFVLNLFFFNSFRCIPRSRIASSYGNFMFNFLRIQQTVSTVTTPFYNPSKAYKKLICFVNALKRSWQMIPFHIHTYAHTFMCLSSYMHWE